MEKIPEIELIDYRKISGKFDAIVSIEMFEAVGSEYWEVFFSKIKGLLRKNGKAAIQTITIGDEFFDSYQKNPDFIQTYIFPEAYLLATKLFIILPKIMSLNLSRKKVSQNHMQRL